MKNRIFDLPLYLVVDSDYCAPHSAAEVTDQAIRGGVTMVQVRSKTLNLVDFTALAQKIKIITDRHQVPLLINDHIEIAIQVKAAGVHLGQRDICPQKARQCLGKQAILGFSVSNLSEAKAALTLPIDYLGAGPLFATQTKKDSSMILPLGELQKISKITRLPIFGIGGINARNASLVRANGAHGIAVISAICSSVDPCAATQSLQGAFYS